MSTCTKMVFSEGCLPHSEAEGTVVTVYKESAQPANPRVISLARHFVILGAGGTGTVPPGQQICVKLPPLVGCAGLRKMRRKPFAFHALQHT